MNGPDVSQLCGSEGEQRQGVTRRAKLHTMTGSCSGCCSRPTTATFFVLRFALAGYYTRETLSALSTEVTRDFELTNAQYGFISTVVAVPTVFLALMVRRQRTSVCR